MDCSAKQRPVPVEEMRGIDKSQRVSVGARYGALVVRALISHSKNPLAECVCDCGTVVTRQRGALKAGSSVSCGCLTNRYRSEFAKNKTHGMSRSSEYQTFVAMKERCEKPSNPHYRNYGGRGIKVLYANFSDFIQDVGMRPPGHWIDRIDNNGHYCAGNCRWVSPSENQSNKRVSKRWIINGKEFESSKAAAKALGVHPSVIVRGCNGYFRRGKFRPPVKGWVAELKYQDQ